jgi:alpha-glucosidase (family GH31 glycosyl hydrolase)
MVVEDDPREHHEPGIRLAVGGPDGAGSASERGLLPYWAGTQFFNVYPLFHTEALYNGFRKDEPGSGR